jgi:hypothetical protein
MIFSKPLNIGLTDFPNVASSHRNQHVAGAKVHCHARDNPVQIMLVEHVAPQFRRGSGQIGRRHFPNPSARLSGTEDLGHGDLVRIVKTLGQFVQ